MKLRKRDLEWAAEEGLLAPEQVEPLWKGLGRRSPEVQLSFETAAYVLGSIVVLGALSWFTVRAWQIWGDGLLTLLLIGYAASFLALGRELRFGRGLPRPGNILFVLATGLTPLIVLGILRWSGLWDTGVAPSDTVLPGLQRQFVAMSGGTVLVGATVLRRAPAPLLVLPIVVALAALWIDGALWVLAPGPVGWNVRRLLFGLYGVAALGVALRLDHHPGDEDWALWPYVVGIACVWGALTSGNTDNEWVRFTYFVANVGLLALSVLVRRRIIAVAGALGALIYLVTISNQLFRDSLLFPVALIGIGVAVIFAGASYRRHEQKIEAWAHRSVPAGLRAWLPPER